MRSPRTTDTIAGMPSQTIPPTPGTIAKFAFAGLDAAGQVRQLLSLVATIDNYAAAYVAKVGPANPDQFAVVPKGIPAAGVITTVTVTLTGTALDGTVLPSQTAQVDIQGPPAPPPATHLSIGTAGVGSYPIPVDPGSATVTLI